MPGVLDLSAVGAARDRLARATAATAAARLALAAREAELAEAARHGASAGLDAAREEVASLRAEEARLEAGAREAERDVRRLRDEALAGVTPEQAVGQLDGQVPVVLLPVRLETRYTAGRDRLRVRIFPDTVHVDTHEPGRTTTAEAAGRHYWEERWRAAGDGAAAAAWRTLAGQFGAERAAYVARTVRPSNVEDLGGAAGPAFPEVSRKAASWTRAPRVVGLPDRFVVIGYRAGREVFRRWGASVPESLDIGPGPDAQAAEEPTVNERPPAEQPDVDLGEHARWLADYDEAERLGLAITVTGGDLTEGSLDGGVDRLVVVGVDWSRAPDASAAELARLLDAHSATDGLELLRQGTATNNTATTRSARRGSRDAAAEALDPAAAATPAGDSGGRLLATALGLQPGGRLDDVPGAALRESANAFHMNNALWEATWGYFLAHMMHPTVSPAQVAALREQFRLYVRGRGPLPAIRVGNQPYGVLPVVAAGRWQPGPGRTGDAGVMELLARARGFWRRAAARSPRIGRSGDVSQDLLEVLQHTPLSETLRTRTMFGPVVLANTRGLAPLAAFQKAAADWLTAVLGRREEVLLARSTLTPRQRKLTLPRVQRGEDSESATLAPNYLATLARMLRTRRAFPQVRATVPVALLHALALHAAQIEVGKAAVNLVAEAQAAGGPLVARRTRLAAREPELLGVDGVTEAATEVRVAEQVVTEVSGRQPLSDHIAGLDRLSERVATRSLGSFLASLDHLAAVPTAELRRALLETLDCASHRLDAWYTSYAARRLDEARSQRATGVHVGAFGWVEDLRPQQRPDSLGYVHAPSVGQAAAAAVLRSGHLAHRDTDPGVLAVDLSSGRVRRALAVLDGVRQGQPAGALLGYRFERDLRETDLRLARYVLPFRREAPLATSEIGTGDTGPLEAIAARDVVDGIRLLARRRAGEQALLDRVGVAGADRAAVRAVLARLDDVLDAVSDLMVSEGVYQTVLGNPERAGAALAFLDRQTVPPEPEVVRTPRSGTGTTQQLLVLLQDGALPAAWAPVAADGRAAAEPLLNAWVARLLGDPGRIRFAADVLDAGGTVVDTLEARLTDLDLAPLAVVAACGSGGSGRASELEERLALLFGAEAAGRAGAASIEIHAGKLPAWPASAVGLAELNLLAGAARDVMAGNRPVDARDLAAPSERPAPGIDLADLAGRADRAAAGLEGARDRLRAASEEQPPAAGTLRSRLLEASAAGAPGAVPVTPGSQAADAGALLEQTAVVLDNLDRRLEALARAGAGPAPGASDEQVVAHHLARLRLVFGESFLALPRFAAADPGELAASLADRRALLDGDALAPTEWLQRMALVRPGAGRLSRALSAAEMAGSGLDPTDLAVLQLPHRPGQRWTALPLAADRALPAAETAVVAHVTGTLDPDRPLAGIAVDAWLDVVPSAAETTGVGFGYDAPGARAPQSLLLAVPPDLGAEAWTFDALVDTVHEALELAKMRAVDPQHLRLAGRMLPALYFASNRAGDTVSLNFAAMQNAEDARAGEG